MKRQPIDHTATIEAIKNCGGDAKKMHDAILDNLRKPEPIGMFTIIDALVKSLPDDSFDVSIAPLGNILRVQKDKHGIQVTIGISGVTVEELTMQDKYIGGLLLVNKKMYTKMRKKMEAGK